MDPSPTSPEAIQTFLEALDEAGEKLRELIDENTGEDSLAIQVYLDGAAFIEAGYTMVEQLVPAFPDVYAALLTHYVPLFEKTQRGQINWGEALAGLPAFLRDFAADKVESDLFAEED